MSSDHQHCIKRDMRRCWRRQSFPARGSTVSSPVAGVMKSGGAALSQPSSRERRAPDPFVLWAGRLFPPLSLILPMYSLAFLHGEACP
ncbi:hypothetical protein RHMOL_Rhmol10G0054000 [Rhododendron molle]|uniref:Uncharacterized protein n=1 Tax=Rhododendron molle TaxID=49168 RepID=A0ACC0M063_RHOML|nr:hypothetical protein RHMOL_Rhmol10G0054000 [Rhododendron molle]